MYNKQENTGKNEQENLNPKEEIRGKKQHRKGEQIKNK